MHSKHDPVHHLLLGAVAGFVGTAALSILRIGSQRWVPESLPPMSEEPGEFVIKKTEETLVAGETAEREATMIEKIGAQVLALGYGLMAGALYGIIRKPQSSREPVLEGSAFGLVVWAAGYLGWLPAARLMPPVTRQRAAAIAGPVVQHLVFGVVTAWLYRFFGRRKW